MALVHVHRDTYEENNVVVMRRRFFASMILSELIREVPLAKVALKYSVARGALQQLQTQAAMFANLVSKFCARLNWCERWGLLRRFSVLAPVHCITIFGEAVTS